MSKPTSPQAPASCKHTCSTSMRGSVTGGKGAKLGIRPQIQVHHTQTASCRYKTHYKMVATWYTHTPATPKGNTHPTEAVLLDLGMRKNWGPHAKIEPARGRWKHSVYVLWSRHTAQNVTRARIRAVENTCAAASHTPHPARPPQAKGFPTATMAGGLLYS